VPARAVVNGEAKLTLARSDPSRFSAEPSEFFTLFDRYRFDRSRLATEVSEAAADRSWPSLNFRVGVSILARRDDSERTVAHAIPFSG
jgi:hypothetical protein